MNVVKAHLKKTNFLYIIAIADDHDIIRYIIKIMVVKTSEEMKHAFKTVKLGVSGYLSKQETMACIKEAIFCVLSGKEYISQVLANRAQDNFELGRH